ncbi:MAG: PAS domain-containing protein, partial [Rhizobiaceae bacterium]
MNALALEIIPFGMADVDNILQREPHRAEMLAFGAILLDRNARILKYNKAEGLIAGRNPDDVMGRNFFNEIAPCAKGKRFHGEFL